MRRKSETLDEIAARRKVEAIKELRHKCKSILAAIERGEYKVYWDWCTGFCHVTAAGYVMRNL